MLIWSAWVAFWSNSSSRIVIRCCISLSCFLSESIASFCSWICSFKSLFSFFSFSNLALTFDNSSWSKFFCSNNSSFWFLKFMISSFLSFTCFSISSNRIFISRISFSLSINFCFKIAAFCSEILACSLSFISWFLFAVSMLSVISFILLIKSFKSEISLSFWLIWSFKSFAISCVFWSSFFKSSFSNLSFFWASKNLILSFSNFSFNSLISFSSSSFLSLRFEIAFDFSNSDFFNLSLSILSWFTVSRSFGNSIGSIPNSFKTWIRVMFFPTCSLSFKITFFCSEFSFSSPKTRLDWMI